MNWGGFWDGLGKGLAKAGVWCASHPQVIVDVVTAAVTKNPTVLENIPSQVIK